MPKKDQHHKKRGKKRSLPVPKSRGEKLLARGRRTLEKARRVFGAAGGAVRRSVLSLCALCALGAKAVGRAGKTLIAQVARLLALLRGALSPLTAFLAHHAAVIRDTRRGEERPHLPKPGKRASAVLRTICHLLLTFGVPFLMLLLSQAITLQSFPRAWAWIGLHPAAALLTCLFFTAFQAALRAIFRTYTIPTLLSAVAFAGLTLVSYYKTVINGFPLMISDFTLMGEATDIFAYAMPKIRFSTVTLWCAALYLLCILFAVAVDRRVPYRARSSFAALALSLPMLLMSITPGSISSAAAELTRDFVTQEERLDACGVVCGLYGAWITSQNSDPESYTTDNLNRISNKLYLANAHEKNTDRETVRPHIFLVLSESFFDITRYPALRFSADPLPNYHALSERYTSGSFISSTYAGGTGYVELEVLSGLSQYYLNEADALTALAQSEDDDIYEDFPSIARDLRDGSGYQTVYLHSHNSILYNRPEIMASLGFDEVLFNDDFATEAVYDGTFVSDDSLVDEIIYRFEHRDAEKPMFMQVTTMENHQPYTSYKFPYPVERDYACDLLDEEDKGSLDALVHGLKHTDAALGRLVDYFEGCGEPVMLVFYGDHLPAMALSNIDTLYSKLGSVPTIDSLKWTPDELKGMLSTNYLIWTNYEQEPQPDAETSSILLGAAAVRRAGLPLSPFFDWLNDTVADTYLMSRPRLFVDAAGVASTDAGEECQTALQDHKLIEYDLVYGEQMLRHYLSVGTK